MFLPYFWPRFLLFVLKQVGPEESRDEGRQRPNDQYAHWLCAHRILIFSPSCILCFVLLLPSRVFFLFFLLSLLSSFSSPARPSPSAGGGGGMPVAGGGAPMPGRGGPGAPNAYDRLLLRLVHLFGGLSAFFSLLFSFSCLFLACPRVHPYPRFLPLCSSFYPTVITSVLFSPVARCLH